MFKFSALLAGTLLLAGSPVMLLAQDAPPVLNAPPTAPAAPATVPVTTPAMAPPLGDYVLGRTYRVETMQGTAFTGSLVSMSLTKLEFETPEMGHISLDRTQVRRADLQGPAVGLNQPGYFDIGNGNRLFFAPTGRGLRKGEATLQDVDVYLVGLNYGITDNFSLGAYLSIVPGLSPDEQLLVLTPKLSFPVSDKVHVGAGVLYLRVPTGTNSATGSTNHVGVGIGYGAITYGSADDNLTFGVGYGFFEGEIGTTPILQVGGQTRVSRRVSLISENYIIADSRAGMGGLYGIKINWRRTSLGLGAAYAYSFGYTETSYGQTYHHPASGGSTYIIPVYYDFTFRFGKGAKK